VQRVAADQERPSLALEPLLREPADREERRTGEVAQAGGPESREQRDTGADRRNGCRQPAHERRLDAPPQRHQLTPRVPVSLRIRVQ
jgi:hypothetical protein